MKSGPFIKMIAAAFTVEEKTVTVYARALKEAGLLTSGARGVNAPDMTPLDAARMTIALLACDGPSQAVERVRRFGQIRYSPDTRHSAVWRDTIGREEFTSTFPVEMLEEVLAFIYSVPLRLPFEEAFEWFDQHPFALRVIPADVRAELELWVSEGDKLIGERVIPFRGDRRDPNFAWIGRGILVERSVPPIGISEIATRMWADAHGEG